MFSQKIGINSEKIILLKLNASIFATLSSVVSRKAAPSRINHRSHGYLRQSKTKRVQAEDHAPDAADLRPIQKKKPKFKRRLLKPKDPTLPSLYAYLSFPNYLRKPLNLKIKTIFDSLPCQGPKVFSELLSSQ